jgi:hypothetical protein
MDEKAITPMKSDQPQGNDRDFAEQDEGSEAATTTDPKKLSRLERLKQKIMKLQGKDPDIYPMW